MAKSELQGSGLGVSAFSQFIDFNLAFACVFKLAVDETFHVKLKCVTRCLYARQMSTFVRANKDFF